ncbi:Orco [Trypoxylus dichotomus]
MEAAYSCHWYDGSEEAKTFVQIVCQQCQKAMSISGAKFFTISLDLFASKYRHWTVDDWAKVLWSDGSNIDVHSVSGTSYVRKRSGETFSSECISPTVKYGCGSIMIWRCMSAQGIIYEISNFASTLASSVSAAGWGCFPTDANTLAEKHAPPYSNLGRLSVGTRIAVCLGVTSYQRRRRAFDLRELQT